MRTATNIPPIIERFKNEQHNLLSQVTIIEMPNGAFHINVVSADLASDAMAGGEMTLSALGCMKLREALNSLAILLAGDQDLQKHC